MVGQQVGLIGTHIASCYIEIMAKKLGSAKSISVEGNAKVVRNARTGRFVSANKSTEFSSKTTYTPASLDIDNRQLKSSGAVAKDSSLPDDTYAISMEAGEDVFARFDWALTQLAK
ncbi:hypothetical protein [Rhizobium sp. NRK18]|uniref:hypothetical protein n=1 Tax=Rhizobium sp. NRK18 TaxID=2964667 RepID=UPI0021C37E27|nr:hypothetical protein [Rhizobium sp. NRK18]MCQ2004542.1 hypothetical protein [Rhizobium sp. NRK18]